jgi:hypothetical protein
VLTTDPRFCAACRAPIPPGSEVCTSCGASHYAVQLDTPRPPPQHRHRSFMSPPTGLQSHPIQLEPNQYLLPLQPIVALPMIRPISGLAIISMILGVPAIILAVFNAIFDARAALEQTMMPTSLAVVLIVALFCWVPALLALIFGLMAKKQDMAQRRATSRSQSGRYWCHSEFYQPRAICIRSVFLLPCLDSLRVPLLVG